MFYPFSESLLRPCIIWHIIVLIGLTIRLPGMCNVQHNLQQRRSPVNIDRKKKRETEKEKLLGLSSSSLDLLLIPIFNIDLLHLPAALAPLLFPVTTSTVPLRVEMLGAFGIDVYTRTVITFTFRVVL